MKHFGRTIPGKTVLFIATTLFFWCFVASIAIAVACISMGFYTDTPQELHQRYYDNMLLEEGKEIVENYASPPSLANQYIPSGNLLYCITDQNNEILYASANYDRKTPAAYAYSYAILSGENIAYYIENNSTSYPADLMTTYTVSFKLRTPLPVQDKYSLVSNLIRYGYSLRYIIYFIAAILFIFTLSCFIALMCVSARRATTDELCPGPLNYVPFDILVFASLLLGGAGTIFLYTVTPLDYKGSMLCMTPLGFVVGLGLSMSMAARIKQKTLFKNTFIYICINLLIKGLKKILSILLAVGRWFLQIFVNIPFIWKTILILCGISLVELICFLVLYYDYEMILVCWVIEKLILTPIILYVALMQRKLQKAGEELSNGALGYKVDTSHLFCDYKKHGEALNHIAEGLSIAVEDRMKSERMKVELITNVSHDIKTPLTSIINYATLIGNEHSENPNVQEYSEVLVRQSERLKRLIEDLVEASKASTGNLDVALAPCNPNTFLTQAGGEFEEKLAASQLQLIIKQSEEDLLIMADGRRMWRVFDNLMNNICKYAQSGTRVYLSLTSEDGTAIITFKNTSKVALDLSAEELMERFVRGDSSRSTEGNGLGLSIARSMTELQQGTLDLYVDGDLFKVTLRFPIVSLEEAALSI